MFLSSAYYTIAHSIRDHGKRWQLIVTQVSVNAKTSSVQEAQLGHVDAVAAETHLALSRAAIDWRDQATRMLLCFILTVWPCYSKGGSMT